MTVLATRAGEAPTEAELAAARTVLAGLPVQGPLSGGRPLPEQELAQVLEGARARLVRFGTLLDQDPEGPDAVLR